MDWTEFNVFQKWIFDCELHRCDCVLKHTFDSTIIDCNRMGLPVWLRSIIMCHAWAHAPLQFEHRDFQIKRNWLRIIALFVYFCCYTYNIRLSNCIVPTKWIRHHAVRYHNTIDAYSWNAVNDFWSSMEHQHNRIHIGRLRTTFAYQMRQEREFIVHRSRTTTEIPFYFSTIRMSSRFCSDSKHYYLLIVTLFHIPEIEKICKQNIKFRFPF